MVYAIYQTAYLHLVIISSLPIVVGVFFSISHHLMRKVESLLTEFD